MVPDPTVPVVSWAGRVSPVLRRSLRRLGGTSSAGGEATGSIRVLAGSGPALAGTRSTGTVSAEAVRASGTRSTGTVSTGTVSSGTSSTGRIPDGTDAIRPSAAPATNTMTTPSAVK